MKITAQEEYGFRCLLQLGRQGPGASLTIPEISRAEGLSPPYVAKLMRILRKGGLVKSVRGQAGGYMLTRPLGQIRVAEALAALGGRLYQPGFCEEHAGTAKVCPHAAGCRIRSLWEGVQKAVEQVLAETSLAELCRGPAHQPLHAGRPLRLRPASSQPRLGPEAPKRSQRPPPGNSFTPSPARARRRPGAPAGRARRPAAPTPASRRPAPAW